MRDSLFLDVTPHRLAVSYQCCMTAYFFHLRGSSFTYEDGTIRCPKHSNHQSLPHNIPEERRLNIVFIIGYFTCWLLSQHFYDTFGQPYCLSVRHLYLEVPHHCCMLFQEELQCPTKTVIVLCRFLLSSVHSSVSL